jgi:hypothetical protein
MGAECIGRLNGCSAGADGGGEAGDHVGIAFVVQHEDKRVGAGVLTSPGRRSSS